jgi:Zn-dependent protease with chaperone function
MNYFEHQEQARQSTRWLVFLFLIAVLATIGITDVFILFVLSAADAEAYPSVASVPFSTHVVIALGVLAIVFVATLYRLTSLSAGGQRVAEEMGGRLVVSSTKDAHEKRLLNVVEEMAIASGFPVPQVYVLSDLAMNAFAAGYTPHDAIIAVTRGTLEDLSRDELQGVIAHEFSHILNGDMRLNLRLAGVVFGILFI